MNTSELLNERLRSENEDQSNKKASRELSVEERYEKQRILFEEEKIKSKRENDKLLTKIIDRDAKTIKLQNDLEDLKSKYQILENQHFSGIRASVDVEARHEELDPERAINKAFVRVVERQASEANKRRNKIEYWLV